MIFVVCLGAPDGERSVEVVTPEVVELLLTRMSLFETIENNTFLLSVDLVCLFATHFRGINDRHRKYQ